MGPTALPEGVGALLLCSLRLSLLSSQELRDSVLRSCATHSDTGWVQDASGSLAGEWRELDRESVLRLERTR